MKKTLEEAVKSNAIYEAEKNPNPSKEHFKLALKRAGLKGAKWQAEKMYSEEDMMKAYYQGHKSGLGSEKALTFKEWLEQFKKK
jgi:hypothetical protein